MFALQPELKVFSGSANRDLAERICKYSGVPLGQAIISSFLDFYRLNTGESSAPLCFGRAEIGDEPLSVPYTTREE